MTSVLLESKNLGSGSWVRVAPQHQEVVISGMDVGDVLEIKFLNHEVFTSFVYENKNIPLPEGTERIRVNHIKTSGSRVSVDLA